MGTIQKLRHSLKRKIFPRSSSLIKIQWFKKEQGSWLCKNFRNTFFRPPEALMAEKIERLAGQTDNLGPQPLWEGYRNLERYPFEVKNATRSASQVRIMQLMGNFFAYLVNKRKPSLVVEFGTAFGISGMYFLSGLKNNNYGKLITFEPNERWAEIARKNLSAISNRYRLVIGTFEDNIDSYLAKDKLIDIAFIDAIHTSEFVKPQFSLVVNRLMPNGIILLDDINFSQDMAACWKDIAFDERVKSSASLSHHVGIVEIV